MARLSDDAFRIFISHKHEDHELASTVKKELENLIPNADRPIECFVSGEDIVAATDWDHKIRSAMATSHMLLLLFTNSSHKWDWCLYETGLFARFEATDIHAIVCMYEDAGSPPGPLGAVQGVPMVESQLVKFFDSLCHQTHEMSDDWRRGALATRTVGRTRVEAAAKSVLAAFKQTLAGVAGIYHPCHRVVLDIGTATESTDRIPDDAKVLVGDAFTTSYTMGLFGYGSPRRDRSWLDMLTHAGAEKAEWRTQLDAVYAKALRRELFTPVAARFVAWDDRTREPRAEYKPILYQIERRTYDHKPVGITLIFDRVDS